MNPRRCPRSCGCTDACDRAERLAELGPDDTYSPAEQDAYADQAADRYERQLDARW